MLSFRKDGIAHKAGVVEPGTYIGVIEAVETGTSKNGNELWRVRWQLADQDATIVDQLLVSGHGSLVERSLLRICDVLTFNHRPLDFAGESEAIEALQDCTAKLTVVIEPLEDGTKRRVITRVEAVDVVVGAELVTAYHHGEECAPDQLAPKSPKRRGRPPGSTNHPKPNSLAEPVA